MADKDFKIKIGTEGDPKGAEEVEKAIDELDQSQVKITDNTRENTAAIEENRKAFAEWQAQRKAERQNRGRTELATDPKEFYDAEAEAIRKVQEAEQAAIRTKEAARQAALRDKAAKQEAREAARRLRLETQELTRATANKQRALNASATAVGSVTSRMGAFGAVLRSVINPYALLGTAIGLATGLVVRFWQSFSSAPKEPPEALEKFNTLVGELNKKLEEFAAGRGKLETADLGKIFDREKESINRQTDALIANIEQLKLKSDLDAKIEAAQIKTSLANLDAAEASGELEPEKAKKQRAALEKRAAESELANLRIQETLDTEVAEAKVKASAQELLAAQNQLEAGEESLRAAREIRQKVSEAFELLAAVEDFQESTSLSGAAKALFTGRTKENNAKFRDAAETIDESGISREEAGGPGAAEAVRARIAALERELAKLPKPATDAAAAVTEAREAFEAAQRALDNQTLGTRATETIREIEASRTPPPPDQSPTIDALAGVTEQLGTEGELGKIAATLKGFISDKVLTAAELEQTQILLGQYFAKIANLGSAQNAQIRDAVSKVDELEREMRAIRNNQSNPNP